MRILMSCLLMAGLSCGAAYYAAAVPQADPSSVSPESLLPKDSVIFLQFDGANAHMPGLRQTAKWQALDDSRLRERVFDIVEMLAGTAGPDAAALARQALDTLFHDGISLGISLDGEQEVLSPYGVIVLHGAASMKHDLISLLFQMDPALRRRVETRSNSGRQIFLAIPRNTPLPRFEFALWAEEEHLVFAVGVNASDRVIATTTGTASDITQNALWKSKRDNQTFTVTQVAGLDFQAVTTHFQDIPLAALGLGGEVTVGQLLETLGLARLEGITVSSEFKGAATWEKIDVIAPEPRSGLLELLEQRNISLNDLPPLPPQTDGVFASSFDIQKAVAIVLRTVCSSVELLEPQALSQFEAGIEQFTQMMGDPRDAVAAGLGHIFCIYSDPGMLPFPIGFSPVIAASVRDRQALTRSLDMLSRLTQSVPNVEIRGVKIRRTERDDATWYSVRIPEFPIVHTIVLTNDWVVASLTPGSCQAFLRRSAGRLRSCQPAPEYQEALAQVPDEFTCISLLDPRPGYRQLMSYLPIGVGILENMLLPELSRELGRDVHLPFAVEDLPVPTEITEPMFPNVAVSFTTPAGTQALSRSSVPANPIGSVGATVTVPVLVSLLLPAVQQAREAARRMQSKNNLKQIAMALHNYHDVYGKFPAETVENEDLDPEKRLGWAVSILPFIEQYAFYEQIRLRQGWQDEDEFLSDVKIPTYQNPSMVRATAPEDSLDYLGVAGLGPDAARLDKSAPSAGVFGYDRKTQIRDITDGTSSTLMVADSTEPVPWFSGHLSIRGFTVEPYINGPDGFGSYHPGGMQAALADGSVRFISESIDSLIMEAHRHDDWR